MTDKLTLESQKSCGQNKNTPWSDVNIHMEKKVLI